MSVKKLYFLEHFKRKNNKDCLKLSEEKQVEQHTENLVEANELISTNQFEDISSNSIEAKVNVLNRENYEKYIFN